MKKILSVVLILVIAVTVFASCQSPEESIVGTWTYNETVLGIVTERTYVFNADHTGTAPGEITGDLIPLEMRWSIYEQQLSIEKPLGSNPHTYTFDVSGDTLTLTKADGTVITMTRVAE